MKSLLVVLGLIPLFLCHGTSGVGGSCKLEKYAVPDKWTEMVGSCTELLQKQVEMEIFASMNYLAMGTHFAQDNVNRLGFSEFFFKSASEERQHAIKIIEYLLMRGQLTTGFSDLIQITNNLRPNSTSWERGVDALKAALLLETKVTDSIKRIMDECEEPQKEKDKNDYHLVDYLTTEYLEEQYKGQRDLAGKISTLGKMMKDHGALAEFLFDKKLLNGEV